MRIVVVLFSMLLLFSLPMACGAEDLVVSSTDAAVEPETESLAAPLVTFEVEKIKDIKPPLYNVNVYVNGKGPNPVITVEKVGTYTAELRAQTIVERLEKAWDALGDTDTFRKTYNVLKNRQYNVYVIGATKEDPELPPHIMQADPFLAEQMAEREDRALKLILESLENYLQGVDYSTKAPEDKKLEDQKQVAHEYYTQAMRMTEPKRMRSLLERAICFNPEHPMAYERLAAVCDELDPAHAGTVRSEMQRFQSALAERLEGDGAWDARSYSAALEHYKAATQKFPDCVTYYWLQSMVYEKIGQKDNAVSILNDAVRMLETSTGFVARSAGNGDWKNVINARIALIKGLK